jgi:hypothetical protein
MHPADDFVVYLMNDLSLFGGVESTKYDSLSCLLLPSMFILNYRKISSCLRPSSSAWEDCPLLSLYVEAE